MFNFNNSPRLRSARLSATWVVLQSVRFGLAFPAYNPMSSDVPSSNHQLINPDAPISNNQSDLCGDIETAARPLSTGTSACRVAAGTSALVLNAPTICLVNISTRPSAYCPDRFEPGRTSSRVA